MGRACRARVMTCHFFFGSNRSHLWVLVVEHLD